MLKRMSEAELDKLNVAREKEGKKNVKPCASLALGRGSDGDE